MAKKKFGRKSLSKGIFVEKGKYVVIRMHLGKKLHFEQVGGVNEPGIFALAEARRDKVKEEFRAGGMGIAPTRGDGLRLCVRDAVEIFKKLYVIPNKDEKGQKAYAYFLSLIVEYFGSSMLDEITKEDVQAFRVWLAKRGRGNCDASVNKAQTALTSLYNRFYEWCEDRPEFKGLRLPLKNPSERCPKPDTRYRDRTTVLATEEFDRLVNCADDRTQRIILGLAHSALRQCDMKRLRKSKNIDRTNNMLIGFQKKTGLKMKEFNAPISPEMWQLIETAPDDLVFDFRQFKRRFERARERAGLPNVWPRDLRRTTGRTLLDRGEDIDTVRQYLGHADIKTTQRYVRARSKDVQEATKVVSGAFKMPLPATMMGPCSNCGNRPADRFRNGLCVYCDGAAQRKWRPMIVQQQTEQPEVAA